MKMEIKRKLEQQFSLDKTHFKIKTITRGKEGHYILTKGAIQEDKIIVNIYVPNRGTSQYIRQMLIAIKE